MTANAVVPAAGADEQVLRAISQRALWIATAIVDAANNGRPWRERVGGHQASSKVAAATGVSTDAPWDPFPAGSAEQDHWGLPGPVGNSDQSATADNPKHQRL